MSVNQIPDYPLDDLLVVTEPSQLRVLADPLRGTLSELLLERAATVTELAQAVAESAAAHAADDLRCLLFHARIAREDVRTFWAEVQELARKFSQIPRAGDQVYGFTAGLYPTDAPTLPDPDAES